MKLRYTERTKDDVELAFAWHEKQRRGPGFEFLDCVEIAEKSILKNPEIYRIYYSWLLNLKKCTSLCSLCDVHGCTNVAGVRIHKSDLCGESPLKLGLLFPISLMTVYNKKIIFQI